MKTIFNKALWASAIGACTLSLGSCTDLSETIYDTIASEKYEFTEKDRAAMFAPVYSSLRDVYWGWYSYADMMDQSSDSWCIPYRISIGWGDLYVSMHKHQFHSQIAHFNDTWNRNYAGINACNKLLADEVIAADITTSSQLRAYRALYYYILFDLFRNIPLDTQYEHEDGWLPEQATPQQMWDFLISELTDVKGKCGTKVEMGKLNDYAINMLLAKMYLNHNAWFNDYSDNSYYGKAIDEVNEVINSGKFSLAPNYSDNFREDISGSPEIIFGIPFEFNYAGGNYMANMWMHVAGRATWQFNGWATGGAAVLPQFLETYDEEDSRYEDCWISGQQYDYAGAPIYVDSEPLVYTRELHSIDNPGCYPFESERLVKYEILSGDYGTSYDDVPFFRLADAYFIKAECFSPGDVVRIDALTDDGQYHAWAEVTVPQRPHEITDIDTVTVPLTQYYYTQNYLRYKINIKDRPNENNFYRLIMDKQMTVKDYNNEIGEYVTQTTHRYHFISREDVVLTDGQPTNSDDEDNGMFDTVKNIYGVFDDSRFKNTSYTMTVYNQTNVEGLSKYGTNVKMDIIVRLLSITETEYYYLKALNLADSDAYDETINEPIKYPGNVHGGVGIVGISTETSKIIHIEKPWI